MSNDDRSTPEVPEENCSWCKKSFGPCPDHRVDRSVGPNDYMRDYE